MNTTNGPQLLTDPPVPARNNAMRVLPRIILEMPAHFCFHKFHLAPNSSGLRRNNPIYTEGPL